MQEMQETRKTHLVTDLEIVGYAGSLNKSLVPRVVAPIFQYRDNAQILLFPPFRIPENHVLGGTTGTITEMQEMVDSGRATRIEPPIPALPEHSLWINSEMAPLYADRYAVEEELKATAWKSIAKAKALLLQGDIDGADTACVVALNADDRIPDPLIIRSVICRRNGRPDLADVMRDMALTLCGADVFDPAVEHWIKRLDASDEAPAPQQLDTAPQTTEVREAAPVSSKLDRMASARSKFDLVAT